MKWVSLLACRVNFCFFSNSPTTVWLTLCPRLPSSSASRAQALAGPAQRRHRIAARVGFDQRVQFVEQTRVRFGQRFASPARSTHASERRWGRRIEVFQPPSDRARGDARDARDRGYASTSRRTSLRSGENLSLPFIQWRRYRRMARFEPSQEIFVDHPLRYDDPSARGIHVPHFHPNLVQSIQLLLGVAYVLGRAGPLLSAFSVPIPKAGLIT